MTQVVDVLHIVRLSFVDECHIMILLLLVLMIVSISPRRGHHLLVY